MCFPSRMLAWLVTGTLFCTANLAFAGDLTTLIDREIAAKLTKEKVFPAPPASDGEFLRRTYLDLVGTIPTATEAREFLQSKDANKRKSLIQKLLNDPGYAIHQSTVWDQVLFGRDPLNEYATRTRSAFQEWLRQQFEKNRPYDQIVRELILAEQDGSEMYQVQFRNNPEEATVAVSRIFLGIQLQCARCHDHPYENWTQKDFYGMAGFFVRLVVQEKPGSGKEKRWKIAEKSSGEVLFTGPAAEQKPGQKGVPIPPKFITGKPLEEPALPKDFKEPDYRSAKDLPKPFFSRKTQLANWLVDHNNPYFARALANRIWAQFMGRGLVHPVDDLSEDHPPSHPVILDALSKWLVEHHFDLKSIIPEIMLSEAYQRSSEGDSTVAMPRWYERSAVRPLSAEQLIRAFRQATEFDTPGKPEKQLPSAMKDYMMRYFGTPTDGQGEFQGSLTEHLFLNNGGHLQQLSSSGSTFARVKSASLDNAAKTEELYLSILSRFPTENEKKLIIEFLDKNQKVKIDSLIIDIMWALMNTSEFRFNH
ncbi:MAG: DUF1549 and DUF1553 domain-containing protein [Zavarzinella sp.]